MSLPSATTPACTQVTVLGLTLYIPDSTNSDLQYLAYLQVILMTLLITIFSLSAACFSYFFFHFLAPFWSQLIQYVCVCVISFTLTPRERYAGYHYFFF
jgi:hypothetical protein